MFRNIGPKKIQRKYKCFYCFQTEKARTDMRDKKVTLLEQIFDEKGKFGILVSLPSACWAFAQMLGTIKDILGLYTHTQQSFFWPFKCHLIKVRIWFEVKENRNHKTFQKKTNNIKLFLVPYS